MFARSASYVPEDGSGSVLASTISCRRFT